MTRFAPLLGLLIVLGSSARAEGESTPLPAPRWEFSITPYLWATALEGTLVADDTSADIDVSFSDILDVLDAGVLVAFEARRGRFSIASNVIYMKVSDDAQQLRDSVVPGVPASSFEVRTTTESAIIELRPAWEVLSLPLFGEGDAGRVALDLGPGARIWWLDQHLDVKLDPGVPLGPFSRRFDESTDWVDFVAAARVRAQLTEKLRLVVSGDYGGFDIGSSSHRTWLLAGFLAWRLGEHWDLAGGWRTLEIERGALDLEMAGPLLGAIYRF